MSVGPKTLIEIEGWAIRVYYTVDKEPWATHTTCPTKDSGVCGMRYSWFTTDDGGDHSLVPACVFCRAPVPDEIQALVRLHKGEM